MERLFVYGTLRPGHENAPILENIGGEWLPGWVHGTFYARGWGAAADFPGIVLDKQGPRVDGYLFISDKLAAHWPMLDEFEEGYDRVAVEVTMAEEQRVTAWIYQLQPPAGCSRPCAPPAAGRAWTWQTYLSRQPIAGATCCRMDSMTCTL